MEKRRRRKERSWIRREGDRIKEKVEGKRKVRRERERIKEGG